MEDEGECGDFGVVGWGWNGVVWGLRFVVVGDRRYMIRIKGDSS